MYVLHSRLVSLCMCLVFDCDVVMLLDVTNFIPIMSTMISASVLCDTTVFTGTCTVFGSHNKFHISDINIRYFKFFS